MSHGTLKLERNTGNQSMSERNTALKSAAADWASGLGETARQQALLQGRRAEGYVREHPGRFIVGACCLGLMAGFFLGRGRKSE